MGTGLLVNVLVSRHIQPLCSTGNRINALYWEQLSNRALNSTQAGTCAERVANAGTRLRCVALICTGAGISTRKHQAVRREAAETDVLREIVGFF